MALEEHEARELAFWRRELGERSGLDWLRALVLKLGEAEWLVPKLTRYEDVFATADREGVPCWRAAEVLAERRIEAINRVRLLNTGGQFRHR